MHRIDAPSVGGGGRVQVDAYTCRIFPIPGNASAPNVQLTLPLSRTQLPAFLKHRIVPGKPGKPNSRARLLPEDCSRCLSGERC